MRELEVQKENKHDVKMIYRMYCCIYAPITYLLFKSVFVFKAIINPIAKNIFLVSKS